MIQSLVRRLGAAKLCALGAVVCLGLGVVVATSWSVNVPYPDGVAAQNVSWAGIRFHCGTLLHEQTRLYTGPVGYLHGSSDPIPLATPPSVESIPAPPGELCRKARRAPMVVAVAFGGVGALLLVAAWAVRRRGGAPGPEVDEVEAIQPPDDPGARERYPWLAGAEGSEVSP